MEFPVMNDVSFVLGILKHIDEDSEAFVFGDCVLNLLLGKPIGEIDVDMERADFDKVINFLGTTNQLRHAEVVPIPALPDVTRLVIDTPNTKGLILTLHAPIDRVNSAFTCENLTIGLCGEIDVFAKMASMKRNMEAVTCVRDLMRSKLVLVDETRDYFARRHVLERLDALVRAGFTLERELPFKVCVLAGNEEKICGLCESTIGWGDVANVYMLDCDHVFHGACLDKHVLTTMVDGNAKCPTCLVDFLAIEKPN